MTQTKEFLFIGGSYDGSRKSLRVREDGRMPELVEIDLVENTLGGAANARERYLARRLEDKDSRNGSMFVFQHEHDERGVCEALIAHHREYAPPPSFDTVLQSLIEGIHKIDRTVQQLSDEREGYKIELGTQKQADALSYKVGRTNANYSEIKEGLICRIGPASFYRPGSLAKIEEAAQLGETKEVSDVLVQGVDWDAVIDVANDMIPKVLDLFNDEIEGTMQESAIARLLVAHGVLTTTGIWMTGAIGAGRHLAVPSAYHIARTMSEKIGAHIWEEKAPGQALN